MDDAYLKKIKKVVILIEQFEKEKEGIYIDIFIFAEEHEYYIFLQKLHETLKEKFSNNFTFALSRLDKYLPFIEKLRHIWSDGMKNKYSIKCVGSHNPYPFDLHMKIKKEYISFSII